MEKQLKKVRKYMAEANILWMTDVITPSLNKEFITERI